MTQNNPGQCWKPPSRWNSGVKTSGTARTVAVRGSHAPPPLAARGSTRRRENNPETGGSASTSSLLPFLTGGENGVTCKAKQKPHPVDFTFSLLFPRICFFFFFFRSASFRSVTVRYPRVHPCSTSGCWASSALMVAGSRSKSATRV